MTRHHPEHVCPHCGSVHVTAITLPIPLTEQRSQSTRRANRCLDCATQWPPGPARPEGTDGPDPVSGAECESLTKG